MTVERWGHPTSRRRFMHAAGLTGLGLLAGCGRWPGQAPVPTVHRIGMLTVDTRATSEADTQDFRQGLRELGYDEQHLVFEWRGAEWQSERLPGLAAELVTLNVDLIVALGSDVGRAALQATTA